MAKPLPSMVCATLYALMPYHFVVDLLVRQDLGELASYIWMPLIIYFTNNLMAECSRKTRVFDMFMLAFVYFCLILSHLATALLFTGALFVYVITLFVRGRTTNTLAFFTSIVLGIGLSAIYILPALSLLGYTRTNTWTEQYFSYEKWFFFNGSAPSPDFARRLFLLLAASTFVFFVHWGIAWLHHADRRTRRWLVPWIVLVVGAWLLMTPLSKIIWRTVPMLRYVQFPWRVAVVLDLAVCATALFAMQNIATSKKLTSWCTIGVVTLLFATSITLSLMEFNTNWKLYQNKQNQAYLRWALLVGCTPDGLMLPMIKLVSEWPCAQVENLPADRVIMTPQTGNAQVLRWQSRRIELKVTTSRETQLIIHQFFFPGWHAWINDYAAELPIVRGEATGLIQVAVPKGHYEIGVNRRFLPSEAAGAAISGGSFLLVLMLLGIGIRKQSPHNRARE
jgi:hypothetical protein